MNTRVSEITRTTAETEVRLVLDLDGTGRSEVSTGVGFLNHMLQLFAGHSLFDLKITAKGDQDVDDHHTTEDLGIVLGQAIERALGDKRGIRRYGHCVLPMDEALVTCAVDLSGRPFFAWNAVMPSPSIGTFDSELVEEFFRAMAMNVRMNLHVILHSGRNSHHVSEAIFKATARAMRIAVALDARVDGIPSTKGSL